MSRRSSPLSGLGVAAVALLAPVASGCGLVAGLEDHAALPGSGASAPTSASASIGGAGGVGGAGGSGGASGGAGGTGGTGAVEPGPCEGDSPVVFVDDAELAGEPDGTRAKPLRTIGAALARAKEIWTLEKATPVVCACEGLYEELVTIDFPVTVRGAGCGVKGLPTAIRPKPGEIGADGRSYAIALEPGAAGATLVELQAMGPATSALSIGILVRADDVTLDSVYALGPSEGAEGPTIGLSIEDAAGTLVRKGFLHGGGGVLTAVDVGTRLTGGSTGLKLVQAGATVEDSWIEGGSGRSTAGGSDGSIGVSLYDRSNSSQRTVLRGNLIQGGTGATAASKEDMLASVGVLLVQRGSEVVLEDDRISGGTGSLTTASPPARYATTSGVVAYGCPVKEAGCVPPKLALRRSAVHAGVPSGTKPFSVGVALGWRYLGARVESNFIHTVTPPSAPPSASLGVYVDPEASSSESSLVGNTFVFGRAVGAHHGLTVATASGAIDNNLFVSVGSAPGSFAITAGAECQASAGSTLRGNAFVGTPVGVFACPGKQAAKVVDAEQLFACGSVGCTPPFPDAIGANRSLQPTCTAGEPCVTLACAGPTCGARLFQFWDDADAGIAGMFGASKNGLRLVGSPPCEIAREGLGGGDGTDFYGESRTEPFSTGAEEVDANCSAKP